MHGLTRRMAGMTAAALLLAASSMLAFPAGASAETKTVPCGSEVEARPGDRILATDPLLGVVTNTTNVLTGTINALLGTVCKVTVKVVDTVTEPIPGAKALGDAVEKGLSGATGAAKGGVDALRDTVAPPPQQPQPNPGGQPPAEENQPAGNQSQPGGNPDDSSSGIPRPDSHAIGSGVPLSPAFLPLQFSSGYAPMRDYSGIPIAYPGLYAPSPGIRYGNQIPGYTPEFDVLGRNGSTGSDAPPEKVSKAGGAKALPGTPASSGNPASLPVLLAVIALAASTAALVRTWVLRRA